MTIRKLILPLLLASCATEAADPSDFLIKDDSKADTSVEAVFVDLEFDGELVTDFAFNPRSAIDDQLLYTIGHLNGLDSNGVGRLDKVKVSNIQTESLDDGMTRVTYHAVLPTAWGRPSNVPDTHTLRLPHNASFTGLENFTEKYKDDCVDIHAHDVDAGIMWYYYRPNSFGCSIDAEDVVSLEAQVSMSPVNTTGKYPEYHKIWEDDALRVLAVFGKNEEDATDNFDAGISAFNTFVGSMKNELGAHDLVTVPADVPFRPGIDMPDVEFRATLPDGKEVVVTALLIDGVRVAGPEFDARYESLTGTADLISYSGHSGLGANIRALAQKGDWVEGQYSMVFMNGCDTYAYVDSALADAHAAVNADDPNGTKYMDIITNAQPSFFHMNSNNVTAFIRGLMAHDAPQTYEQMFARIDSRQVVLVSGEEDNEFFPGFPGGGDIVEAWGGFNSVGSVTANEEHHFVAPAEGQMLAAGTYVFEISGSNDADLYVRVGQGATEELWDCRPFLHGSTETCVVELSDAAPVHVMVRGWASSSDFELTATKQ